jgi:hypothetical protein
VEGAAATTTTTARNTDRIMDSIIGQPQMTQARRRETQQAYRDARMGGRPMPLLVLSEEPFQQQTVLQQPHPSSRNPTHNHQDECQRIRTLLLQASEPRVAPNPDSPVWYVSQ